jgi:hypothetical protein
MGRSIRTVRQFEQVFEPYRRMLKELNEKKEAAHITKFLLRKH